jgi:hypothetical protein
MTDPLRLLLSLLAAKERFAAKRMMGCTHTHPSTHPHKPWQSFLCGFEFWSHTNGDNTFDAKIGSIVGGGKDLLHQQCFPVVPNLT